MAAKRTFGGKWLWILIALALAGGGWFLFHKHDPGVQYQTAPVARGDLISAVTATGTLNPITNVTVGSQVSGNIAKLYADWNTPVKANQVVAELDPALYQAAVDQAEGDLANANANHAQTREKVKARSPAIQPDSRQRSHLGRDDRRNCPR